MTLTATKLFPFKDGYGVHSGYCVETNPTKFDATWATTNAFQLIDPAQTYDRTTAPAKPLRQPALPLRIAYGKLPNPNSTKPNYVGGANVVAKLIPPSTQSQCKDTELVPGITMDANYGLQSYPTNVAATTTFPGSGTSPLFATGLAGMVTKKPTATNGFDPGLPFGRWQVCADYKDGSSSRKRIFTTIDNKHTGTAPTIYDLDVNSGRGRVLPEHAHQRLAGHVMTGRLRREDGFTIPELLITISMSMIIALAGFGLLDTSIRRTGETQRRVEATQRGRQALDQMTRQLRSQVCLSATTPAMAVASPLSATFYVDLSNHSKPVEQRVQEARPHLQPGEAPDHRGHVPRRPARTRSSTRPLRAGRGCCSATPGRATRPTAPTRCSATTPSGPTSRRSRTSS